MCLGVYHSVSAHQQQPVILNSFHEAVYLVGLTTNRSCFKRVIGHNSRTIHRICTTFDARILPLYSLSVCQISRRSEYAFAFYSNFTKKKENEEKKLKLWQLVSRKWLKRFPSNLVCRLPWLAGNSVANLVPIE